MYTIQDSDHDQLEPITCTDVICRSDALCCVSISNIYINAYILFVFNTVIYTPTANIQANQN